MTPGPWIVAGRWKRNKFFLSRIIRYNKDTMSLQKSSKIFVFIALLLVLVWVVASVRIVPAGRGYLAKNTLTGEVSLREGKIIFLPRFLTRAVRVELSDAGALGELTWEQASGEGVRFTARAKMAVNPRKNARLPDHDIREWPRGVSDLLKPAVTEFLSEKKIREIKGSGERIKEEMGKVLASEAEKLHYDLTVHEITLDLPGAVAFSPELKKLAKHLRKDLPPIMVIGWDGADWEFLQTQMREGRLPHLSSLIQKGVHADYFTLKPMISPLIWTTMFTGVKPDVHGILDFVRPDPETREKVPITSLDRKVPAIWNILTDLDLKVGVVAMWATWPAEPVKGFMVSDRLAYQLDVQGGEREAGVIYPPSDGEWMDPLRREETDYDYEDIRRMVHITSDEHRREVLAGGGFKNPIIHLHRLLASTETYHNIALEGWKRYRPELMILYLEGPDTIGHLFAPHYPPRRPFIDSKEYERYKDAGPRYYEWVDQMLGELREAAGSETNIILCSDHGFKWGSDRPRESSSVHTPTAAWWHRDPGMIVMAGPDIRSLPEKGSVHVLDLMPTLLALMGLPPGKEMAGEAPAWALKEGVISPEAEPVDYGRLFPVEKQSFEYLKEKLSDEYIEKLRSLGYLVGGESAPKGQSEKDAVSTFLNLGTVYLEQGKPKEALEAYQKAAKANPRSPGVWLKMALAQRKLEDREGALDSYRNALKLSRDRVHRESAYLGCGVVLGELGKESKAAEILLRGAEELRTSFILWKTLGELSMKRGDHETARAALRKAVELEGDTYCLNTLAALEIQLGGDRETAARLWKTSLQIQPNQPRVKEALRALESEAP